MSEEPQPDNEPSPEVPDIMQEEEASQALKHLGEMNQWYYYEALRRESQAWRLQVLILVISSLITVVAALPVPVGDAVTWVKWFVVVLSATVTFCSGLLSKSGIERTAQLREQGRVKTATLLTKATLQLTLNPMTKAARLIFLNEIAEESAKIEEQFGVNPLVAGKVGEAEVAHE